MSDFPWLLWIASTLAFEVFLFRYIRRCERAGSIQMSNWPPGSGSLLRRADDEERFNRLILAWRRLMFALPLIIFGLLYLGDY